MNKLTVSYTSTSVSQHVNVMDMTTSNAVEWATTKCTFLDDEAAQKTVQTL